MKEGTGVELGKTGIAIGTGSTHAFTEAGRVAARQREQERAKERGRATPE